MNVFCTCRFGQVFAAVLQAAHFLHTRLFLEVVAFEAFLDRTGRFFARRDGATSHFSRRRHVGLSNLLIPPRPHNFLLCTCVT